MAPMKRPAATKIGGVSKKAAIGASCGAVKKALAGASTYPEPVLAMLGNTVSGCLSVAKEERHPFQEQVIHMVAEVLSSVETCINAQIAEAEKNVSEVEAEKSSKDQAEEAANVDLVAKAEAVEAAKTAFTESQEAFKVAKSTYAIAESQKQAGDAEFEGAAAQKQKLESGFTSIFTPLKEGAASEGDPKQSIATMIKLGKEFKFDASLLTSLPSALSKAPDARGTFDAMVITQAEEDLQKQISDLSDTLALGEPKKAEREAKVQAAAAMLAAASEKEQSNKAVLKEAQDVKKEAEVVQKAAAKAVHAFAPDMKQVAKGLEAAKSSLKELKEGALAAFKELVERSAIEPAAPEEEAPVAEEPSAVPAEA